MQIPEKTHHPKEDSTENQKPKLFPNHGKRRYLLIGFILVLFILLITLLKIINIAASYGITPQFAISLIADNPQNLKQYDGRTNLLLLGISGGDHEGSTLSDTMMVISLDGHQKNAVMISLPRDIWSVTLQDKINSAYTYGQAQKKGGGIILAKSIVEEVTGLPIHYAMVVDFSGFKDLIDQIRGIDVNVEEAFADSKYPIPGKENDPCAPDIEYNCRYETIEFKKGIEHMDGDTVLKYVRSRNSTGDQGNDIARGKRQQDVILAVKDKLLHQNPLDFTKNKQIFQTLQSSLITDMNLPEMIVFAKEFSDLNKDSIKRPTLATADPIVGVDGFLINPPIYEFDGKWVLIPKEGNGQFDQIHQYISCWIKNPKCDMTP